MRLVYIVGVMYIILTAGVFGKMPYKGSEELKSEALHGTEEILELWRAARFDELYERTVGGTQSREAFVKRLLSSPRKPSCCWERIQEVKMMVKDDSTVIVKAKFGFEVAGKDMDFSTKPLKLTKEEGVWKMAQADILSLAGEGKKASKRAKHKAQKVALQQNL